MRVAKVGRGRSSAPDCLYDLPGVLAVSVMFDAAVPSEVIDVMLVQETLKGSMLSAGTASGSGRCPATYLQTVTGRAEGSALEKRQPVKAERRPTVIGALIWPLLHLRTSVSRALRAASVARVLWAASAAGADAVRPRGSAGGVWPVRAETVAGRNERRRCGRRCDEWRWCGRGRHDELVAMGCELVARVRPECRADLSAPASPTALVWPGAARRIGCEGLRGSDPNAALTFPPPLRLRLTDWASRFQRVGSNYCCC